MTDLREYIQGFSDEMRAHAANPATQGWIADHSIADRLDQYLRLSASGQEQATAPTTDE